MHPGRRYTIWDCSSISYIFHCSRMIVTEAHARKGNVIWQHGGKPFREKNEKKKKWDSYFGGVGLLLFTKRESQTPTFKILVRTLLSLDYFTLDILYLFFEPREFDISCKLSLLETICMICQIQFPEKKIGKLFQNVICWKLMVNILLAISAENILMIWLFFSENNLNLETICMKCQILFPGEKKKK